MILEKLVVNQSIILETLHNQWARDPRDGKALDCLHFDEYCVEVLDVKSGVDVGLFGVEIALKSALKPFALYVILYTLGYRQSEVESQENLENVKETISKIVDDNWPEFYAKIKKSYSPFLHDLNKDR
ncbi:MULTISPECIES: hypothetical protein [Pseudomonas]|uniref:Uncharacterized protein n=1 Tax=Pseudomonas fulva TaxID=47880 RepID=A0A7S9LG86_9PSED|nr:MULTISPECIES: hypothetical protein [Pseudomonas]MCE0930368.1 hypothetical protein [Pseudomonas monteilii]MCE0976087.1 hypothetical protein [Pseudomonas monteilii]MCE1040456.1 hypothetical protein [Pseudomonas monteilii]MDI3640900.1 hypothetical protein [Pseudomonas aeruginosa]MDI3701394.1 hypothetical protein [Pseudomonas aeruginosa]